MILFGSEEYNGGCEPILFFAPAQICLSGRSHLSPVRERLVFESRRPNSQNSVLLSRHKDTLSNLSLHSEPSYVDTAGPSRA